MGTIKYEVETGYLARYPQLRPILQSFLPYFEVSYARDVSRNNATVHIFLLKPDKKFTTRFGISQDIFLVYSPFRDFQARTLKAADSIRSDADIAPRIDKSICFIVSDSPNGAQWISNYSIQNSLPYIPVHFFSDELTSKYSRDVLLGELDKALFTSDLFHFTSAITNDHLFFGRHNLAQELLASLRRQSNIGLFGLRRIGKTSLLLKIGRDYSKNDSATIIEINCVLPHIQEKTYSQLLNYISDELCQKNGIPRKRFDAYESASEKFIEVARASAKRRPIALLFDEIEYISHFAIQNKHWQHDFVPFWQTVKGAQQQIPGLGVMIAGVNARVCEEPKIKDIDNPTFRHFTPVYLKGLDIPELSGMIHFFGSRMGLRFTQEAINRLHHEYGGHPLFTRTACSFLHRKISTDMRARPCDIDLDLIDETESERNREVADYCKYITFDLNSFYPEELDLLEKVACGDVADYIEFYKHEGFVDHIRQYGLLSAQNPPSIRMKSLQEYLRRSRAVRDRKIIARDVVPHGKRAEWLGTRLLGILSILRQLQANRGERLKAAGVSGALFSHQEEVVTAKAPISPEDFSNFVSKLNMCFVEALGLKSDEFFSKFRHSFPDLFSALHRIKVYRHWRHHIKLEAAKEALNNFLQNDLEGQALDQVAEWPFLLAQICVDSLYLAAVAEDARE